MLQMQNNRSMCLKLTPYLSRYGVYILKMFENKQFNVDFRSK